MFFHHNPTKSEIKIKVTKNVITLENKELNNPWIERNQNKL